MFNFLAHKNRQEPNAFNPKTRGDWGEYHAAKYLTKEGIKIVQRQARPCKADQRCELDIIAFDPKDDTVIFIEVKTHKNRSPFASRLWAINKQKKRNLLRAAACWLMSRKWHGNFRFDVIEIYGEDNTAEIDHIHNVPLFPPNWRFW